MKRLKIYHKIILKISNQEAQSYKGNKTLKTAQEKAV